MNELTLTEKNGVFYADSREIAEMLERQHGHLMRDIKGYAVILTESNFGVSEFFIEATYKDSTGRTLPRYLCSKKGCDMIANKMTGEKGVLFTAAYIEKFYEMEKQLQQQVPNLSPSSRPRYRARMINTAVKDVDATVKAIQKMFGVREGIAQATAIEMVENAYGIDLMPVRRLISAAIHETGYLNATMIGERIGNMKARDVNLKLEALGLQRREVTDKGDKIWRLTEKGKEYAEEKPYKRNGHSGYHINWNEKVLGLFAKEVA